MKEVSKQNFGLLIAYLLPGLVVLWGVSYFSATVRMWLTTADQTSPTVAGFLYVTLAAFTAGLTLSAIRAVTLDVLHHHTGVPKPTWDFSEFQAKFWAFNQLVESHYCFYQFYAHMCLAVPALIAAWLVSTGASMDCWSLAGCLTLEFVLLAVSRGKLKAYYTQASDLLGTEKSGASSDTPRATTKRSGSRRGKQSDPTPHAPSGEQTAKPVEQRREPGNFKRW